MFRFFTNIWFRPSKKTPPTPPQEQTLSDEEVLEIVNVIRDAVNSDNVANGIEKQDDMDPLAVLAVYRAFQTGNVVVANRDKNGNCTIKELPSDD